MSSEIRIQAAYADALSQQELLRMYALMIEAYAVTEREIWGENYVRMPLDEYTKVVEDGNVFLARLDSEIVGTIHAYPIGSDRYGFGLLAADFAKKGLGIGRKLIAAAEHRARTSGARVMTLEILRPKDLELPVKKQLHEWYTRQGYQLTKSMSFLERKPDKAEKAKNLITPSVFDCYEKLLE